MTSNKAKKQKAQEASEKKKTEASEPATKTVPKEKRLLALCKDINKHYDGHGRIMSSSQVNPPWATRRLPTGILSLDIALAGGFPAGGISVMKGKESIGKTYQSLRAMALAQKRWGSKFAGFVGSVETSLDKIWARDICGLEIAVSEQYLQEKEEARGKKFPEEYRKRLMTQVGFVYEIAARDAATMLGIVADCVESGEFQLGYVDSLLAMQAVADAEGEIGEAHYGGISKEATQFANRIHTAYALEDERGERNSTALLIISQLRDKMGAMQKNVNSRREITKDSGGHAIRHAKMVDIEMWPGDDLRESNENGDSVRMGGYVHWEISKGKCGIHGGTRGKYLFDVRNGVRTYEDIIDTAVSMGVIAADGSYYTMPDGTRVHGKANLYELVGIEEGKDPKPLQEELTRRCLEKAGISVKTCW